MELKAHGLAGSGKHRRQLAQHSVGKILVPQQLHGTCWRSVAVDSRELMLPVGGESEASTNVLDDQLGVVLEDLFFRHPLGQPVQHVIDRDTHAADAGLPASLAGLDGDAVLIVHTRSSPE